MAVKTFFEGSVHIYSANVRDIVCEASQVKVPRPNNTFKCLNEVHISSQHAYDGFPHCSAGEDEKNCNSCLVWGTITKPISTSCKCGKLFYLNDSGICVSFTHVSENSLHLMDIPETCFPSVVDQPLNYVTECLQCSPDNETYFRRDLLCVYNTTLDGKLQGCSNGAHLRKCNNFQCYGMFKCEGNSPDPLNFFARV